MNIGFVGCGKLGLMVALSIESRGHTVKGYDVNSDVATYLKNKSIPFKEEYAAELLQNSRMQMVPLRELCDFADLIFIAIQTPHQPEFEGTTRVPQTRTDFDYSYLKEGVRDVNDNLSKPTTLVVVSTVLPGTIEREIRPLIGPNATLIYGPLFIAMGTVYSDFLNPEFVLMGVDNDIGAQKLEAFYETINNKPRLITDIKTAEAIKVLYNTFITTKTVLGNLYGELAHKLGANADDIYTALALATDRIISPKYLKAGMGDGGACHPRDNIALSYLSQTINLSYDIFESLMVAREAHTEWLADLIIEQRGKLSVYILGESFKPETNIKTGSAAVLLSNILTERGVEHRIGDDITPSEPALYFIGTKHMHYQEYEFPKGSIVIDPFRYIKQDGITLTSIGHKK